VAKTKAELEAQNRELKAQLALVDYAIQRVAFVDDSGQPVLQSHERMHKHHGSQPYIGCIFCRDDFGQLDPLELLVDKLRKRAEKLGPSSGEEGAKVAYGAAADELVKAIHEAREMASAGATRTGVA
jgi:hypothetical protein